MDDLRRVIEHTCLRAEATAADVERLCEECVRHDFLAAVVPPFRVAQASEHLTGSGVRVVTVVGFPFGYDTTSSKRHQAEVALAAGAHEIDMVMNIGAFMDADDRAVTEDIAAVAAIVHSRPDAMLKVILETALLPEERIAAACVLAESAGTDFVKTSTGFAGGATEGAVALMRRSVSDRVGVKAAGGIRDEGAARRMLAAGATRIGSSASVAIVSSPNVDESHEK